MWIEYFLAVLTIYGVAEGKVIMTNMFVMIYLFFLVVL